MYLTTLAPCQLALQMNLPCYLRLIFTENAFEKLDTYDVC